MHQIENNPFRVLGIATNASAKDLAANLGRKRLLSIGKDVAFPLDLPSWLPPVSRTATAMDEATTAINLPEGKIRHALFWLAQPSDPIGKQAYEYLLAGQPDLAASLFSTSNTWESRQCLSVLHLQAGQYAQALAETEFVISQHRVEFVESVAGRTHTATEDDMRNTYLDMLAKGAGNVLRMFRDAEENGEVPQAMLDGLRDRSAKDITESIENAITTAKSTNNIDDVYIQLLAAEKLLETAGSLQTLCELVGADNPQYLRIADSVVSQIIDYVVNYNNYHNTACTLTAAKAQRCASIIEQTTGITVSMLVSDRVSRELATMRNNYEALRNIDNVPDNSTNWGCIIQAIIGIIALISWASNL